jgi:hypothetical protein
MRVWLRIAVANRRGRAIALAVDIVGRGPLHDVGTCGVRCRDAPGRRSLGICWNGGAAGAGWSDRAGGG